MEDDRLPNITVINCLRPGAEALIEKEFSRKKNFVLISSGPKDLGEKLTGCCQLGAYKPDVLHKWGIFALNDVLAREDLNLLLESEKQGHHIVVVEALKLPNTRPPFVKPVILYCQARGIMTEHEDIDQARQKLTWLREAYVRSRSFPLAGIYQWGKLGWQKVAAP